VEGVKHYDSKTAPAVFDVVWCKYPKRESPGMPGEWVRPVLVLDVRLMTDARDETEWAAVTVAYGTDAAKVPQAARTNHLLIRDTEYRALGLHKSTVFKLDVQNRKRLPWAEEFFVSQGYVRGQGIISGHLTAHQEAVARGCFIARGLTFPLP
jgi:hypothetical protein